MFFLIKFENGISPQVKLGQYESQLSGLKRLGFPAAKSDGNDLISSVPLYLVHFDEMMLQICYALMALKLAGTELIQDTIFPAFLAQS